MGCGGSLERSSLSHQKHSVFLNATVSSPIQCLTHWKKQFDNIQTTHARTNPNYRRYILVMRQPLLSLHQHCLPAPWKFQRLHLGSQRLSNLQLKCLSMSVKTLVSKCWPSCITFLYPELCLHITYDTLSIFLICLQSYHYLKALSNHNSKLWYETLVVKSEPSKQQTWNTPLDSELSQWIEQCLFCLLLAVHRSRVSFLGCYLSAGLQQ